MPSCNSFYSLYDVRICGKSEDAMQSLRGLQSGFCKELELTIITYLGTIQGVC